MKALVRVQVFNSLIQTNAYILACDSMCLDRLCVVDYENIEIEQVWTYIVEQIARYLLTCVHSRFSGEIFIVYDPFLI